MQVRLNRRHLDGSRGIIQLRCDVARACYVPVDKKHPEVADEGRPEVILVYERIIPGEEQEPELYSIPHREREEGPQELWLRYPLATVMLLSRIADDEFRRRNPRIVRLAEALYVE